MMFLLTSVGHRPLVVRFSSNRLLLFPANILDLKYISRVDVEHSPITKLVTHPQRLESVLPQRVFYSSALMIEV